ncbi:MAG TPA: FAD-linked oxidase C-terminal domain-containing protein [Terriglobales bacterium]|nr:FAD-linked oxidase C-terminal domain-containing protein [Terriglobales bacterium]
MGAYDQLRRKLEARFGRAGVIGDPVGRMLYEYDGGVDRATPDLVVFPQTREDVIAAVKLAHQAGAPLIPRGAGTGLSGGAVAREGGVILSLNRMRRIVEVDVENLRARVEPGVVNLEFSDQIAPTGFYFVPDPSSQKACTIGGNVAENSGGPHTLAYGVTVNHVTGLEIVLADGAVARLGGKTAECQGYDLVGPLVGSEGTLAIVTEITVKLTRRPEAARTLLAIYDAAEQAAATVSAITAEGIVPAALEMFDGFSLRAVEAYIHAGYPLDSAAVLLIEVEGLEEEVEEQAAAIEQVCARAGARETRRARDEAERAKLWLGRKHAFGAMGRLSSNFYVMDGVIPRTKIGAVLAGIERISAASGLRIGNIFHAGDGNLHPLVFFDQRVPGQFEAARAASEDIIRLCVEMGGSITGEHGVGMEKDGLMPLIFSEADLDFMRAVKQVFNPEGKLNPGKLLPTYRSCRETALAAAPAGAAARL